MADPFPWMASELDALREQNLERKRRQIDPLSGGRCRVRERSLWDFASNDYLGLAGDERVRAAAQAALLSHGVGARASALVAGRTHWHARLETRLAEFEQQPAALLFPSGYAANMGVISALVEAGDVVFCDRLNHASLVDGCRLSGARLRVYRHQELDRLERELKRCTGRRKLIVTDSVFSMDGDIAPLPELCCLAERYDAALLVDEAHGTGVFGDMGRGVAEHFHVEERVSVRVGTLSKAIGALGGFVAGPEPLIDWLWHRARSQMFSTALPAPVCAAAVAGLDIISSEPERRQHLWTLSEQLRRGLADAGIPSVPGALGPIVPVIVGDPAVTMRVAGELEGRGFLVGAIRPPTVPARTSRLRISLSAAHRQQTVSDLLAALTEILPRELADEPSAPAQSPAE